MPDDTTENATDKVQNAVEFANNMARVAEQSQEIWKTFLARNTLDDKPLNADPLNAMPAFTELATTMMNHPKQVAEAGFKFWMAQGELWRRAYMNAWGNGDAEPMIEPERGDRRFKDPEWSENAVFDYVKQSYLLTSNWIMDTVRNIGELDERDRKKVDFFSRTFVEAIAPTNFIATNPEVIRATISENGDNLVRGLDNMLKDLERGKGSLKISQTDMDAFNVGENMAMSPGQVVFQNDLIQLIQYSPTTDEVRAKPILFVPPWINKFYILDLNEKKSLIKWMVAEGFTVFVLSWINPDERQRDETWGTYMKKGVLTAVQKVMEETGQDDVNLVGYCIGGTMVGSTLAYMAATDDKRANSATFFTTQLDFSDAGEIEVFVDDQALETLGEKMDEQGYLTAESMANVFNMLRSNDLIWSFVIQNYYLGKDPFPFDLLYWNSDSTCMPANVHRFYLKRFYIDNALAQGEMDVDGVTLDLGKVTTPTYHVAAKEDHIAPPDSAFRGAQKLSSKPLKFVLGGSGHIAGIINPPAGNKYQYWTRRGLPGDTLEEWSEKTKETDGSWWPDWSKWLADRSGDMVPAREPGAVLGVVEPAPGAFVKVRSDQRD